MTINSPRKSPEFPAAARVAVGNRPSRRSVPSRGPPGIPGTRTAHRVTGIPFILRGTPNDDSRETSASAEPKTSKQISFTCEPRSACRRDATACRRDATRPTQRTGGGASPRPHRQKSAVTSLLVATHSALAPHLDRVPPDAFGTQGSPRVACRATVVTPRACQLTDMRAGRREVRGGGVRRNRTEHGSATERTPIYPLGCRPRRDRERRARCRPDKFESAPCAGADRHERLGSEHWTAAANPVQSHARECVRLSCVTPSTTPQRSGVAPR